DEIEGESASGAPDAADQEWLNCDRHENWNPLELNSVSNARSVPDCMMVLNYPRCGSALRRRSPSGRMSSNDSACSEKASATYVRIPPTTARGRAIRTSRTPTATVAAPAIVIRAAAQATRASSRFFGIKTNAPTSMKISDASETTEAPTAPLPVRLSKAGIAK